MSFPKPGQPAPIHPFAEIFPPMDSETFASFREDLEAHGQKEDIVLLDGKVLDGVNRQKALLELEIPVRYREFDPRKDGKSPLQFVAARNLHRRNLTTSQKAAIAVEIAEKLIAEASAGKPPSLPSGGTAAPGAGKLIARDDGGHVELDDEHLGETEALEAGATATGASTRTAARAKRVKQASPKLHKQVLAGTETVAGAEKKITAADRKKRDFDDAVKRIEEVCGKALAEGVKAGTRLKKKGEAVAYASLDDARMLELRGLIENAWSLRDAEKFKFNSMTLGHKIRDLLDRAQAQGTSYLLEINGWEIECRRKAPAGK